MYTWPVSYYTCISNCQHIGHLVIFAMMNLRMHADSWFLNIQFPQNILSVILNLSNEIKGKPLFRIFKPAINILLHVGFADWTKLKFVQDILRKDYI